MHAYIHVIHVIHKKKENVLQIDATKIKPVVVNKFHILLRETADR